ncbi:phosphate acyltransferase PlsX [Pseudoflavonifractor phocaeensis]|uniref:phosphate acyltransferase PlsX n=1 Tax=Pseudoflavonifractor phocaeensis TaxID=1870988 RepID=UPI001956B9FA|nr:phosphate acyltransferase PlsX [Pseudoflavonifractor phocaeensis]MBM6925255.1 phosphate acyltransferase PlsX [Pseudoflavonifractor phocaeensis]
MKIIVDAMGGDNAPASNVRGALAAVKELGVEVILVGQGEEILKVLKEDGIGDLPPGLEIAHASQVVEMCDNPATAFREKKDSSLTVGLNLLKSGGGDAFVSAGSTGALLSAATLMIHRVKGIRRAALAPVVPTGKGGAVLIDCGATAEGTPEYLLQFAFMGSYYAERVLKRPEPRVGLLNIGAEPSKGTDLQREAHALLTAADKAGRIRFVGNVEAREAVYGEVDVIVSDGYSGNIFLKTMEGTGGFISKQLKSIFMKNIFTKLAAVMVAGGLKEFKKMMDSSEVGGTALIGISKPVIKAHGSSNDYAIKNAIRQARDFAASGMIDDLVENIEYMKLSAGEG